MIEVNVNISGFTKLDFERKSIRKTMSVQGRAVQKAARRLVGKKVISQAGEVPGKQTGLLQKSIKLRVSKSGFLAHIAPYSIAGMPMFYPAVLYYGSKKRNIEKRKNFMTDALDSRREIARGAILRALQDSIVPRR